MNVVEKLSDHVVRLGTGTNFKRALSIIKPEKYTMVHGQSLSVGIGGFVQGVGINPMGMTQVHSKCSLQITLNRDLFGCDVSVLYACKMHF